MLYRSPVNGRWPTLGCGERPKGRRDCDREHFTSASPYCPASDCRYLARWQEDSDDCATNTAAKQCGKPHSRAERGAADGPRKTAGKKLRLVGVLTHFLRARVFRFVFSQGQNSKAEAKLSSHFCTDRQQLDANACQHCSFGAFDRVFLPIMPFTRIIETGISL